MTKRIIIVRRNCHEFSNMLWNDMAICAYAFTVQAKIWNLATFETGPFAVLHTMIARLLGKTASPAQYTFLPPTVPCVGKFAKTTTMYFFGWLFRNPEGFIRYRQKLLQKFGPTAREEARLKKILNTLPANRIVIGVHLRLTTYPDFPDGEFLVSAERVRMILAEYMCERNLVRDQVALVLNTDESTPEVFDEFAKCVVRGNERTNFLLLSKCSVVIGTNTTFSNLASWFGDVPHIVTTKEPIDWNYYATREQYFENKYATFSFGIPEGGV